MTLIDTLLTWTSSGRDFFFFFDNLTKFLNDIHERGTVRDTEFRASLSKNVKQAFHS
jgi:hypothetical protein